MYNLDRIVSAIKNIEKYFKQLEKIDKNKISEENNPIDFHASSMLCLAIINRTIDIGTEIIVKKEISMPTRYKEIFEPLANEGIISKELSLELEELAEHRNCLAHEYFELDEKRLKRILRKINFVKEFIERVKKLIQNEK